MATRFYKQKKYMADANQDPKDQSIANKIGDWVEDASSDVSTWRNNQDKWHKLRMRIKRPKNFPFVGCSNIRMPTIDTKIRKLKSSLINVLFGIRPIVQVVPVSGDNWKTAVKIEKFLDHLIMDVIKLKNKLIIIADQTLEKGFYIAKPFYRRETISRIEEFDLDDISVEETMWLFDPDRPLEEIYRATAERVQIDTSPWVIKENVAEVERLANEILAGKESVKFHLKDVTYNAPDIALCESERVYVPSTTGFDPQSASYIVHEFHLPLRTIKSYANEKGWDATAIESVEAMQDIDLENYKIDTTKDQREGISRIQSVDELVRIWECYTWYDLNGDGVEEKCVITMCADFGTVLRKVSLPFYSGKFPFVKFFYELTDDRWFSHRGIPELIEDIVKEIDIQHMQKIDYGTLVNSPMFLFRAGQVGENTMQFLFGQGIPVQGMQDLNDIMRPLQSHNPNVELSYEREQLLLETKVEELIGQVDSSLHSMINKRQPRTATEVTQQQQAMNQIFSLDADMFRNSFEQLLNWIWELFCLYGDDEVMFAYQGREGAENIRMTREEIQGKFKITVRGNDQNTNPVIRQQKASFVLEDTYRAYQLQLAGPQSVMEARKRAYQELGIEGWEAFIQPPMPPGPPPDDIKFKAEDLTDGEAAQALSKRGIKPDVKGRQLNEENRRADKEFEQIKETVETIGGEDGRTDASDAT